MLTAKYWICVDQPGELGPTARGQPLRPPLCAPRISARLPSNVVVKILYLTGGAGQMYCGSCLRDNALAGELIRKGHDVTLLPVYTPTRTDEPNVSNGKVFFGGISVYLEQYVPVFRNSPRWLDRIWDSKPMLELASRRSISTSPKMLGEMTVSMLKGENGFQRKEIEKLTDWARQEAPPEVISLPYSLLIGLAKPIKEALKRPICCTLQGEDLFLEGLPGTLSLSGFCSHQRES